jgi:hypothetical protein
MLRTVADCNIEIRRIDGEIRKLQLQKNNVLNVRKRLKETKKTTRPKN